ncbi:adhesion G protein-coupled receptor E5 isoform X2 [Carettochelys insculpta]|uniref:adhesion G protein-coupled receptor E5 isoform X2 n=1 Tax=Carettochelys insculpta TaxID=44489 RepID=UPI003EB75A24
MEHQAHRGLCIALSLWGAVDQGVSASAAGGTENCPDIICPANSKCVNSTHCTCLDGFKHLWNQSVFDDTTETCDDINECLGPNPVDCGPDTNCTNVPGSYYCTCLNGYKSRSGKANFTSANETTCQDIDECREMNRTICGPNANCTNLPGSHICTCSDGYVSSSETANFTHASENTCQDIDECRQNATICGPHASCINTPGSYMCKCKWGFGKSSKDPLKKCTAFTCPPLQDVVPSDLPFLRGFADRLEARCRNALAQRKMQATQSIEEMLQEFLGKLEEQVNLAELNNKSVEERHHSATKLMASVEKLLRLPALILPDSTISITSTSGTELGLVIRKAQNQSQEAVTLQQNKTHMQLTWAGAKGQKPEGLMLVGLLTYQGLSPVLEGAARVDTPKWDEGGQAQRWGQAPRRRSYRVLSQVVSAFVNDPLPQPLNLSVHIHFSHPPVPASKTDPQLLCAFWEPTSHHWATHGCSQVDSNGSTTHCHCNHLTSFAVLMAFYELEDETLTVITKVGLVISLLFLLLSIVTFLFCRSVQGTRTTIHLHLCLALFLAHALFLGGINSTSNKVTCSVVAGLLHYFFLAAFCWMCLEGVELYLLVVQVFTPHGLKRHHFLLLGYGVPGLVVGVSAAVHSEGYGTERHCWLSLKRGFLWSFLAPVCCIIAVNAVIFVVTVWKLSQKFTDINPNMSQLKKFRALTLTAIAQLCILGIAWIVGIFQVNHHTLVISYIFTFLNCFQGLYIFLLHCLLKKQVRDEYRQWLSCSGIKKPSKYSEFSSSMTTTRGLHPSSQESGV